MYYFRNILYLDLINNLIGDDFAVWMLVLLKVEINCEIRKINNNIKKGIQALAILYFGVSREKRYSNRSDGRLLYKDKDTKENEESLDKKLINDELNARRPIDPPAEAIEFNPMEKYIDREDNEAARKVYASLSDSRKKIIISYLNGKTRKQVAKELGMTPQAISKHLKTIENISAKNNVTPIQFRKFINNYYNPDISIVK